MSGWFTFPDAEEVAAVHVAGQGGVVGRVRVEPEQFPGWHEELPYVHHHNLGGQEDGPFRAVKVQFDVYAETLSDARDIADLIHGALTGPPFHNDFGVVDSVDVVLSPSRQDYVTGEIAMYSATYRVHVRAQ